MLTINGSWLNESAINWWACDIYGCKVIDLILRPADKLDD